MKQSKKNRLLVFMIAALMSLSSCSNSLEDIKGLFDDSSETEITEQESEETVSKEQTSETVTETSVETTTTATETTTITTTEPITTTTPAAITKPAPPDVPDCEFNDEYSSTENEIEISWQPIEGVTGYIIYKDVDDDWKECGKTKDANDVTFKDKNLDSGTIYSYCVAGYIRKDMSEVVGDSSSVKNVMTLPEKVDISKKYDSGESDISISWNKLDNADGYIVYRKAKDDWKEIERVDADASSYKDKSLNSGTEYKYSVAGFVTLGEDEKIGKKSSAISAKTSPGKISISNDYTSDENSISIKWSKVSKVDGYIVYRKEKGEWKEKKKVDKDTNSFKETSLKDGAVYKYSVAGYIKDGDSLKVGKKSSALVAVTIPKKVQLADKYKSDESFIKINWDKSARVTGYIVYKKVDGKWKEYKKVGNDKNEFKDKKVTAGTSYKYCVASYITKNGVTKTSKKSNALNTVTNPEIGKFWVEKETTDSITVKWEKVKCDGYELYWDKGSDLTLLNNLSKDTNSNKITCNPGTKYVFKLRSYKDDGKNKKYSEYAKVTGWTKELPTTTTKQTTVPPSTTPDNDSPNHWSSCYILNTHTKKYHVFGCSHAPKPSSPNYQKSATIPAGYTACSFCCK